MYKVLLDELLCIVKSIYWAIVHLLNLYNSGTRKDIKKR